MPLLEQARTLLRLPHPSRKNDLLSEALIRWAEHIQWFFLKDKPLYSRQLLSMLDWSLSLFTVHVNHKFVWCFFCYLTGASYSSKNELFFWFQVCDFTVHGCVPSLDF